MHKRILNLQYVSNICTQRRMQNDELVLMHKRITEEKKTFQT